MADSEPSFLGLFSGERNPVTLKAGDTLFKKGDPAHCMYVVLSGELSIGDGSQVFEKVSAGAIVGEMGLIDRAPRSATVTAVTPATLAEVDEKRFLFMVRETPSFSLNVLRMLSHRLRRTSTLVSS
jgi:CRP/FNR family transcriptional regulator, cyclic AMP receptor protein